MHIHKIIFLMISIPKRKINNIEKIFLSNQEKIQFALEVSNPDYIPIIIQNFKNYNLGLHLKLEGESFVWHNNPVNIYSLPISIKNAKDACNFIDSIKYDFHDTFSVIAANDNIFAVSVSHMVCDGGFFKDIYNKLLINDPNFRLKPSVPLVATDFFQSKLSRVTKNDIQNQHELMDKITSLDWSKNHEKLNNEQNQNKKCSYYIDESPVEEFIFHKSGLKLTDFYNFAFVLSIMSLNGRMDSIFGTNTCVDLRQFLPKNNRPAANTQNTSIVSVIADHITPKMTVSEGISSLHKDLMHKLSDNSPFIVYKISKYIKWAFLPNENISLILYFILSIFKKL